VFQLWERFTMPCSWLARRWGRLRREQASSIRGWSFLLSSMSIWLVGWKKKSQTTIRAGTRRGRDALL
jgi:hypothetical protein